MISNKLGVQNISDNLGCSPLGECRQQAQTSRRSYTSQGSILCSHELGVIIKIYMSIHILHYITKLYIYYKNIFIP